MPQPRLTQHPPPPAKPQSPPRGAGSSLFRASPALFLLVAPALVGACGLFAAGGLFAATAPAPGPGLPPAPGVIQPPGAALPPGPGAGGGGSFSEERRLRSFAERLAASEGVQTELPRGGAPKSGPSGPMRGGSERARKIVVAVSLGLVSLGLAALVFATIRRLIKAGKAKKAGHDAQAKKEKETEEKAAGLERALRALGSEADALAGAGRFREAIHTLLLDSIAELKKLSELPFPGSLTSRELSVGLPLTQEQKRAFTELVESAEPAWFGPDEGTPEGWRLARASFGRLLRATRAKGGAPQ